MIDKIKRLKFLIGKNNKPFILTLENGLIKSLYPYYNGKYNYIIGWNIYSIVRWLFENYSIKEIYRNKDNKWIKVNVNKIKELAYAPMKKGM